MKRLFALALLAACSPDATPTTAPLLSTTPAASMPVGIGTHGYGDEIGMLGQVGVHTTRITYYTKEASPQYDAQFAARLAAFDAAGIEPLIVVHDFFPYSANVPSGLPWVVMPALAMRFPGRVWQMGNEWNEHAGYSGHDYAYAVYFAMTWARAADPTAKFVGMGLSSNDNQPLFTQQYYQWFAANQIDPTPLLDAWSFHCYGVDVGRCVRLRAAALRAVVPPTMPLWLTEVGADRYGIEAAWGAMSDAAIDDAQAQQTQAAIDAAREAGVARVDFYQLLDGPTDYAFSFFRHNGTMRPSALVVRAAQ